MQNSGLNAFSKVFSEELNKHVQQLSLNIARQYFVDLGSHIAKETGFDEEAIVKAVNSYMGSQFNDLKAEVALSPVAKTVDIWVGDCYEKFEDGNERKSFIVGGVPPKGPDDGHALYQLLSNYAHTMSEKTRKRWGYKHSLKRVQRVWMFPRESRKELLSMMTNAGIQFRETNEYSEKTGTKTVYKPKNVSFAPSTKLPAKGTLNPVKFVPATESDEEIMQSLQKKRNEITKEEFHMYDGIKRTFGEDVQLDEIADVIELPSLTCHKIESQYDELLEKYGAAPVKNITEIDEDDTLPEETPEEVKKTTPTKPVPKKKPAAKTPAKKATPTKPAAKKKPVAKKKPAVKTASKKLPGKLKKRKDGFVWNDECKLVFELDHTKKKYSEKFYCVGFAENLNEEITMLQPTDVDMLKEHGISWDEEIVDVEE